MATTIYVWVNNMSIRYSWVNVFFQTIQHILWNKHHSVWLSDAQKLNVTMSGWCLSVFSWNVILYLTWFLEACINKYVLFWSAPVRTANAMKWTWSEEGNRVCPVALRCMTAGSSSSSWGLLPVSIISSVSRWHIQVSAIALCCLNTLYLLRILADLLLLGNVLIA